jgi:hypothetical protein
MAAYSTQTHTDNATASTALDISDGSKYDQLEKLLLNELECARENYKAGRCGVDQYAGALKRFNNLILYGKVPQGSQDPAFDAAASGRLHWYRFSHSKNKS